MLPGLLLAAACATWHPDVTGYYLGEVESQGPKAIETWLDDTPAGLAGTYILHEPGRDVPGKLEPVGDEGCDTAVFRWTDLYGTGLVKLHFYPARHCFEGAWGREKINPALTWTTCTHAPVTS